MAPVSARRLFSVDGGVILISLCGDLCTVIAAEQFLNMKWCMFNLRQFIEQWRRQMLPAGSTPIPLDELESHLREDVELRTQSGRTRSKLFINRGRHRSSGTGICGTRAEENGRGTNYGAGRRLPELGSSIPTLATDVVHWRCDRGRCNRLVEIAGLSVQSMPMIGLGWSGEILWQNVARQ